MATGAPQVEGTNFSQTRLVGG